MTELEQIKKIGKVTKIGIGSYLYTGSTFIIELEKSEDGFNYWAIVEQTLKIKKNSIKDEIKSEIEFSQFDTKGCLVGFLKNYDHHFSQK